MVNFFISTQDPQNNFFLASFEISKNFGSRMWAFEKINLNIHIPTYRLELTT